MKMVKAKTIHLLQIVNFTLFRLRRIVILSQHLKCFHVRRVSRTHVDNSEELLRAKISQGFADTVNRTIGEYERNLLQLGNKFFLVPSTVKSERTL